LGIIFHQQKLKFENLALFSGSLMDFSWVLTAHWPRLPGAYFVL
jgi:hypothetical protein